MPKKRLSVEQIIGKICEAELLLAQGPTVPQTPKKVGGRSSLPPHCLAVAFAAIAQDDAKDPWPADLPLGRPHRRAGAKIDLGLLGRRCLDSPKRQRCLPPQARNEAPHTVVARGAVAVRCHQILVNPHPFQAQFQLGQDLFPEFRAFAPCSARGAVPRVGGRWWLVLSGDVRTTVTTVIRKRRGGLVGERFVPRIPGGR